MPSLHLVVTYIPVQRGHIFVARHFCSTLLDTMSEYQLVWCSCRIVGHIPNPVIEK